MNGDEPVTLSRISSLTILFSFLFSLSQAQGQDLFVLGGATHYIPSGDPSYSWQLEYTEELGEHFSYTVSYLNEGHFPTHHRDGEAAQLRMRTSLLDRRLVLTAGGGPYFYYDTVAARSGGSYSNSHGFAAMYTLAASWRLDNHWLLQARANFVDTANSIDTFSTLVGIGYQLTPSPPSCPPAGESGRISSRNLVTLFIGQTIVNSFASEQSSARSIEYRRSMKNFDWTLAWINEGDNRLIRRNGITTQLWAVKSFFTDRLALGIGGGPYISVDHYHNRENQSNDNRLVSGIVTMTSSYRFYPEWEARISWNRIVTNYNIDTDVLMGGVGYAF